MFFKNRWFQLMMALLLGALIMLIPRPEGKKFEVFGDPEKRLYHQVESRFDLVTAGEKPAKSYILEIKPGFEVTNV